ncbi:MAG TPA: sulfite exporter TauE/SafE family protein [Burkholderiales bacterium]
MIWLLAYAVGGLTAGFLAGLLGVGGGMTIVPIISAVLTAQKVAPDHVIHIALATAMCSIAFTSSATAFQHHKRGSVDWVMFRRLSPPMVAGTLLATACSSLIPQRLLAVAFALIVVVAGVQILVGKKPGPGKAPPGRAVIFAYGLAVGVIAGLVSAGGAFLTVPFMMYCGLPMMMAIGTGVVLAIPIAIMGSIGYIVSGWHVAGLPDYSLGFIYLPALAAIVCASVMVVPVGLRLAHRLPVQTLRRVFAYLLFLLAAKMLYSYW